MKGYNSLKITVGIILLGMFLAYIIRGTQDILAVILLLFGSGYIGFGLYDGDIK